MERMHALAGEAAHALLEDAEERLGRPARAGRRGRRTGDASSTTPPRADVLVVARDGRHAGPHSIGHSQRWVIDHAPCTVVLAWPEGAPDDDGRRRPSRSRSPSRNRSHYDAFRPAARGPPRPQRSDRLAPAARAVLAAAARPLRRHVHAPRRAARAVGGDLAPRRREEGLHRRPERAARGRGQRILEPLLGARSVLLLDGRSTWPAQGCCCRRSTASACRPTASMIREIAEARGRDLAERRAARHPPAHAGADARDHHARRLRHRATSGCARARTRCSTRRQTERCSMLARAGPASARSAAWSTASARRSTRCSTRRSPRRRAAPDLDEREDILSMLLAGTRHGRPRRCCDELLTLLVAGHETTATALAWALERLARHPRRVGAAARGATTTTSTPCARRPCGCARSARVIRMLKAPFEVGGYTLPAGVAVVPIILLIHTPRGRLSGPVRVPPGALPRAAAPAPTRGSRSAAACAAASARASRCSR